MALPHHLADLETRLAARLADGLAELRRSVEAQLRGEHERILGSLGELSTPPLAELLTEADVAALDATPRREGARDVLTQLLDSLRELDLATSQADVLDAVLDAGRRWADRVALLLARDSGLVSWGDRGFDDGSIAGREVGWDTFLRERLLASRGCLRLDAESAGEVLERFGAPAIGDALVVPLVLRDRIAALFWADRSTGSADLAALQILVHTAGQRLEMQALSDRSYTPTLWEGAEAPGAPLPLWSLLTPAPEEPSESELEPEPEAAAVEDDDAAAVIWQAEEEAVEAQEFEAVPEPDAGEAEAGGEQPPPPAIEASFEYAAIEQESSALDVEPAQPAFEPPAEPATEVSSSAETEGLELPSTPPETELAATAAPETTPEEAMAPPDSGLETEPPFEVASREPEIEEIEPAGEAEEWEPQPEPFVEPQAEAPVADLDTVRMAVPPLESLVPPRPPEETTAPITTRSETAVTHEFPAPTASVDEDISEDATVLSRQRPELPAPPEAPAPPPPPPPAATWSAPTPTAPVAPPPAPAEDPMDRTASRMRSTEVAPPPDVSGPGLAFLAGRAARSSSDPAQEEAKRLARLLISEIRLYNEEQVLEGRRHRDLYHRLKDDIDRSRQIYDERVDPRVRAEVDYFQQELVRSLAGGDPRALGI